MQQSSRITVALGFRVAAKLNLHELEEREHKNMRVMCLWHLFTNAGRPIGMKVGTCPEAGPSTVLPFSDQTRGL